MPPFFPTFDLALKKTESKCWRREVCGKEIQKELVWSRETNCKLVWETSRKKMTSLGEWQAEVKQGNNLGETQAEDCCSAALLGRHPQASGITILLLSGKRKKKKKHRQTVCPSIQGIGGGIKLLSLSIDPCGRGLASRARGPICPIPCGCSRVPTASPFCFFPFGLRKINTQNGLEEHLLRTWSQAFQC